MSTYDEEIDTCKLGESSKTYFNPKNQDDPHSKFVNECYCFEPHTKPKLPYKTPSYFEDIYNNIKLEDDEEQYFPNLYATHLANTLKYDPNSKFLKAMKQKAMKNSKYFYCNPEQIQDFEYTLQRQMFEAECKCDQEELDKYVKNCHKCDKSPNDMCESVNRTKTIRDNDYFDCHPTDIDLIPISSKGEFGGLETSPRLEELYMYSTKKNIPGQRKKLNTNSWALRYQIMDMD